MTLLASLEKKLVEQITPRIHEVTPGVLVRAYQAGRLVVDISAGETWPYYDLASLTKIIFTTQAMMAAFDEGKWSLETKVAEVLPWFQGSEVLISELMTHSGGLPWWEPIYQNIDLQRSFIEKRSELKKLITQMKLNPSDQSVYSDVGFMVLGFVLEEWYQKDIHEVWKQTKERFYSGTTFEFHKDNQTSIQKKLFAPTEECPWRKRLIQGEVHDENAFSLGGVSTHAGLFGTIEDLGWYILHLRSQLMGIARYSIKMKTAKLFATRAVPQGKGDWALGFMMPTVGSASCGHYFGVESIGHTGFVGTSLWYDQKNDLGIAILSNRTLYGRTTTKETFAQLRRDIHNWTVEGLRKSSY